ncbi:MAG: hypothetical protein WBO93_14380, partial [Gammaproteobacteria bacterium]
VTRDRRASGLSRARVTKTIERFREALTEGLNGETLHEKQRIGILTTDDATTRREQYQSTGNTN